MKDEMMLVGVTLARRYTRKQKEIFLAEVCPQCVKLVEDGISNPAFRMLHVCNLVIGDLAHAKTVIACAYDTPASAQLPIRYYPLNPRKNTQAESWNLAWEWILGAACFLIAARGGLYAALVESSDENRRGFGCGPGGLAGRQLTAQPGKPR